MAKIENSKQLQNIVMETSGVHIEESTAMMIIEMARKYEICGKHFAQDLYCVRLGNKHYFRILQDTQEENLVYEGDLCSLTEISIPEVQKEIKQILVDLEEGDDVEESLIAELREMKAVKKDLERVNLYLRKETINTGEKLKEVLIKLEGADIKIEALKWFLNKVEGFDYEIQIDSKDELYLINRINKEEVACSIDNVLRKIKTTIFELDACQLECISFIEWSIQLARKDRSIDWSSLI